MSTVIVFDAAGGRKGGMGARQVGLEVVVMEYKLGLFSEGRGKKKKQAPIFARPSRQRFRQSPYRLKWILN